MSEEIARIRVEMREAAEAAMPGPWGIWREKIGGPEDAKRELALQVDQTNPVGGELFLLNADGKCPATTGCGPTSEANACHIAASNPTNVLALLSALDAAEARAEAAERERAHAVKLKVIAEAEAQEWHDKAIAIANERDEARAELSKMRKSK